MSLKETPSNDSDENSTIYEILADWRGRSTVMSELAPKCLKTWERQITGILRNVNKLEFSF